MSPISLILLFFVIANLPWFTERMLLAIPLTKKKSIFLRLVELIIFYFVSLVIATIFESRFSGGEIHPQTWEFFVTTFCLFLVLSVPGVIYQYQWLPLNVKYK
ncbi:MAG: hypothetical protein COA95_04470 [Methylophaga sp.]|nr:MAG: hypothetical protein COA95_04470 [Methylophaga sp.]